MRKFSEKTIAKVRSAKRKLKRRLEGRVKPIEGIVGYGIGYREREGKLVNRCVIRVYVRRKFSKALLPKNQRIPESVDGIPVDVIEDDGFPEAGGVPTDRHMPLTGGIQIANPNIFPEFGTLGCRLREVNTGEHYALSNWHVLYGREGSGNGEQITQPGSGGALNRIGVTVAGIFNERVDCGLVKIDTSQRNIDGGVLGISGSVTGIRRPQFGDKVISSGAGKNGTSKKGEIDDVELERSLTFAGGTRKFVKQLRIKPRGDSPTTAKGDSGSVWLFEETQELVGLHFAGSQQAAFANPIQAVIAALASRGFNLGI